MDPKYASVGAKGRLVIPAEFRRSLKIEKGTRIAFFEEEGRLVLQPVTDDFIDRMLGVLAKRNHPNRVERDDEKHLS